MLKRTSKTDHLRIDVIPLQDGKGYIGMTICPGKQGNSAYGLPWERDLGEDIRMLRSQKIHAVLTIMESFEMDILKVPDLGDRVLEAGLHWWHLEVPDMSVLPPQRYHEWDAMRRDVVGFLLSGNNLVIHCRGGLGRTGTFASVLLIDLLDMQPEEATQLVRKTRPGCIQNRTQEDFIRNYRDLDPGRYFTPLNR